MTTLRDLPDGYGPLSGFPAPPWGGFARTLRRPPPGPPTPPFSMAEVLRRQLARRLNPR